MPPSPDELRAELTAVRAELTAVRAELAQRGAHIDLTMPDDLATLRVELDIDRHRLSVLRCDAGTRSR